MLRAARGDDAGQELGAVIERMDPIRGDIAELRHTVRGEIAELRNAMEAAIERSAKEQMRFFLLAWGAQLAAIAGLYGTVVALLR